MVLETLWLQAQDLTGLAEELHRFRDLVRLDEPEKPNEQLARSIV
jgi:hypothetical protein